MLFPWKILRNVLKNTAKRKNKLVKMIEDALEPLSSVITDAILPKAAGKNVLRRLKNLTLPITWFALSITIASMPLLARRALKRLPLLSPSSLPRTASGRSAPARPKPAKKTQSVSEPFRTASMSAITTRPAGLTALPKRATPPPAPSGSASSITTA